MCLLPEASCPDTHTGYTVQASPRWTAWVLAGSQSFLRHPDSVALTGDKCEFPRSVSLVVDGEGAGTA